MFKEHLLIFSVITTEQILLRIIEAVAQRCSVKKVFLEILQNSQENTCARVSFLIKLQTSGIYLAFTCSKLTIETLEQGVKYLQS